MKKFFFLTLLILTFLSPQNFVFGADTTKYFFSWQDVAGGYKTEVTIIGKDACDKERNSGEYKITSSCYTPSHQADIDSFNKTAGNYPFTWQMDNFISKQTRKGGGSTTIACNLDRSGKIIDLTPAQLASWTNTKLCTDLRGVADPYYFNWLDNTTKLKFEVSFVNKADCEKEQVNKKYTNATACYTPSQQSTINTYNQAQVVDPKKEPNEFNPDYTLLAPIGNVTTIGENTGSKIGDYLNIILLVAIGLCGALAVIMIVIRGIQYMGDESVFGKTEAKHHIMQAIFGLLLALGAYAILNTINPNLVGGSLTFNQVNIELEPGVGVPEGKSLKIKNSSGQIINAGSCSGAKTKTISIFGSRTTVQEDLVAGLLRIDKKWKDKGGESYYKVHTLYGFNCRNIAGTNTKSAHAFGLALDINPQENPFQNTLKTNIPRPEFVQWFKDEGWGWGGNWNGKKDPMHFSKFKGEGGDIDI